MRRRWKQLERLGVSLCEIWDLKLLHKDVMDRMDELRGKNLACWCPLDQPCHADVLLEIANK